MEDESMKTKYTEDQIAEAVARVAGGESRSSVARSMGMTNCANVSRWCEREERDVLRRENSLGSKEREGLRLENKRLKDRIKALLAGVTMIAVLLGCSEPPRDRLRMARRPERRPPILPRRRPWRLLRASVWD